MQRPGLACAFPRPTASEASDQISHPWSSCPESPSWVSSLPAFQEPLWPCSEAPAVRASLQPCLPVLAWMGVGGRQAASPRGFTISGLRPQAGGAGWEMGKAQELGTRE